MLCEKYLIMMFSIVFDYEEKMENLAGGRKGETLGEDIIEWKNLEIMKRLDTEKESEEVFKVIYGSKNKRKYYCK